MARQKLPVSGIFAAAAAAPGGSDIIIFTDISMVYSEIRVWHGVRIVCCGSPSWE
jgi:hypothetical protein